MENVRDVWFLVVELCRKIICTQRVSFYTYSMKNVENDIFSTIVSLEESCVARINHNYDQY